MGEVGQSLRGCRPGQCGAAKPAAVQSQPLRDKFPVNFLQMQETANNQYN
jgi:hypothetical protein